MNCIFHHHNKKAIQKRKRYSVTIMNGNSVAVCTTIPGPVIYWLRNAHTRCAYYIMRDKLFISFVKRRIGRDWFYS